MEDINEIVYIVNDNKEASKNCDIEMITENTNTVVKEEEKSDKDEEVIDINKRVDFDV